LDDVFVIDEYFANHMIQTWITSCRDEAEALPFAA